MEGLCAPFGAVISAHAAPRVTLDMRGPRGGLTAERAQDYVDDILSGKRNDFNNLVLSTWAFSVEAAEVVARAIEALPSLEAANLADIIAGRPEAEGLAVFRVLGAALGRKRLRELDLSDNAVGPKGVEACREMLSLQEELEVLSFNNCGISAEAMRSIADILLFRVPTRLKMLHFSNNMSGSGGAIALADVVAASPMLEDFRFASSRGGGPGAVALAQALATTRRLRRLDLHDNIFAAEGGAALAAMLRGPASANLLELDVSDILLRNSGVKALASSLVRSECAGRLQVLGLAANEISGPVGAAAVSRLLRRLTGLRVLRLEENELESDGVRAVAAALPLRARHFARAAAIGGGADPLAVLNVASNAAGGAAIVRLAAAAGRHLPSLEGLDVRENEEVAGQHVKAAREALGAAHAALLVDEDQEEGEAGSDDEDDADDEGDAAGEEPVDSDADDDRAPAQVAAAELTGDTAVLELARSLAAVTTAEV